MGTISRRSLLKAVGVLGGATLAGSAIGCSPQETGSAATTTDAQSGGQASFEIAPEALSDDLIAETIEADVVVVGAGTAGLTAALSTLQHGLSVTLISASSQPISRGGSNNAIYSKTMESYGVDKVPLKAIENEFVQASYRVDHKKWSRYYQRSEEVMNWLIDIMEGAGYMTVLEDCAAFGEDTPFYQPVSSHSWCPPEEPSAGGGQGYVVATLASEIEKAGGTIYFNNIARQLVRGGSPNGTSGRVDAVLAERADGTYAKYVGTKAVVLATGDFSGNGEMMKKYCSWAAPYFNDIKDVNYDVMITMQGLYRGDGQQMGLWVGAAWQNTIPNSCMGGNILAGPWRQLQENFLGLLLNKEGVRYMNEAATSALGGMPALQQPDHEIYAIWDYDYAQFHEGKWHPFGSAYELTPPLSADQVLAQWDMFVENGSYIRSDTLEGLVEELGLPSSALDTIKQYNAMCDSGADTEARRRSRTVCRGTPHGTTFSSA